MRVKGLWILVVALGCASVAGAAEDPSLLGENNPPATPVRFYGELGFRDFLKNEPPEPPVYTEDRRLNVQRHIYDSRKWQERSFPKFGFHATGTEYYFAKNFGKNLIGRFFREGYGAEVAAYIHLDEGVDFFVAFDWAWHRNRRDELAGARTELTDFNTYAMFVGLKPFGTLKSVLGMKGAFFRNASVNMRIGLGATYMESIRRLRPLPEEWFWNARTLGTLHATVGFKYRLSEGFHVFADNGLRLYTPPNASSTMRPNNETGPFAFLIWQVGVFIRVR